MHYAGRLLNFELPVTVLVMLPLQDFLIPLLHTNNSEETSLNAVNATFRLYLYFHETRLYLCNTIPVFWGLKLCTHPVHCFFLISQIFNHVPPTSRPANNK